MWRPVFDATPALSAAVRQRVLALPESYHENQLLLHAD